MGRTIRTITDAYHHEEQILTKFRRGLRKTDQISFDDLMVSVRKHMAAASLATDALPMEMFLLAMLLEQQKELKRMAMQIEMLAADGLEDGAND